MTRLQGIAVRITLIAGLLAAGATSAPPQWVILEEAELEPAVLSSGDEPLEFAFDVEHRDLDGSYEVGFYGQITHASDVVGDTWPVVVVELRTGSEVLGETIVVVESNGIEDFNGRFFVESECLDSQCTDTFTITIQRVDDAGGILDISTTATASTSGGGSEPDGEELVIVP